MTPRAYSLGRRGEAAEETRRRIVEATFELHGERGIADTTVKQIAERAGVSVGTVYHHFATYEDVIMACGAHTMSVTDPPTAAILDGAGDSVPGRVRRLAEGVCGFYERAKGFELVRADRRKFAVVEAFMAEFDRALADLARLALRGTRPSARSILTVRSVLDVTVYRTLRDGGLSPEQAAAQVAAVLTGWLCCDDRPT